MDRNTLTGLVLIGAILIGYSWWMQPSQEELEAQRKEKEAAAAEAAKVEETSLEENASYSEDVPAEPQVSKLMRSAKKSLLRALPDCS